MCLRLLPWRALLIAAMAVFGFSRCAGAAPSGLTPGGLIERIEAFRVDPRVWSGRGAEIGVPRYAQDRTGRTYFVSCVTEWLVLGGEIGAESGWVSRVFLRLTMREASGPSAEEVVGTFSNLSRALLRIHSPTEGQYRMAVGLFSDFLAEAEAAGDSYIEMSLGGYDVRGVIAITRDTLSSSVEIRAKEEKTGEVKR